MILKSFKLNSPLVFSDLQFNKLNLVVGLNGSGKTRVIYIIRNFAGSILQQKPIYRVDWEFHFQGNNGKTIEYRLDYFGDSINENLVYEGKSVLERKGSSCKLWSFKEEKWIVINPPEDKLVIHVRRDSTEFPFFEDVVDWAERIQFFNFASIHPESFSKAMSDEENLEILSTRPVTSLWNELTATQTKLVIEQFRSVGYPVEEVWLSDAKTPVYTFRESGMDTAIVQQNISQGTFRAFSLLVFINYLINKDEFCTVLLDDLCEGLDNLRSRKLGELLFSILEDSKIQFFATTNDSFLMEAVDIKYWNILKRDKKTVSSFNYSNSRELFDEFKMTGLDNFDLFTSNYLSK